jgi:hypothetical protein
MLATIKSIKINAVDRSTTSDTIIHIFKKYADISNIRMEKIETSGGGKYNRVFIDIKKWKNTEEANEFIKLVHNGTARLNYWWDIQDNTQQIKKTILHKIEEEGEEYMDNYMYMDDEWKDIMIVMYGRY